MEQKDAFDPEHFEFRGLHPSIRIGTASDRYAGWIGQIYSGQRYQGRISSRSHKVGAKIFQERTLPVESVEEYFHHFSILEIDYTFYALLLDATGRPTRTYHVLKAYRDHLGEDDGVILKVPQIVFAQKLLRSGKYVNNDQYLDSEVFTASFYRPAEELLRANLRGLIFEQEYQRKSQRTPLVETVERLEGFFSGIPSDERYHIELRTDAYLAPPIFQVLAAYGVGQVFSHWTWLPPLSKQFNMAGGRFFNGGKQCVIRLMTPLGKRYEDAYAEAHPFDQLVDGMLQPKMIEDTVELMQKGLAEGVQINLIINNRAGGNAPLIARSIAESFSRRSQ